LNDYYKRSVLHMTQTKGLAGVVAAHSSISSIIDDQLTYVGYKIDDLAEHASFEEVIYLLWYLRLPNHVELTEFKKELTSYMSLSKVLVDHLHSYDLTKVHPMASLRTAVSFMGMLDADSDVKVKKQITVKRYEFKHKLL